MPLSFERIVETLRKFQVTAQRTLIFLLKSKRQQLSFVLGKRQQLNSVLQHKTAIAF